MLVLRYSWGVDESVDPAAKYWVSSTDWFSLISGLLSAVVINQSLHYRIGHDELSAARCDMWLGRLLKHRRQFQEKRGRVSSILPGVFPLGKFCHCLTLICYLLYAQKTGIFLMDHRRLVPGLTRQSGRASPGELTGMSGSVCLSTCLCLSVCEHISGTECCSLPFCAYYLLMVLGPPLSALWYVPVLCITSCLHIMATNRQCENRRRLKVTGKVAALHVHIAV